MKPFQNYRTSVVYGLVICVLAIVMKGSVAAQTWTELNPSGSPPVNTTHWKTANYDATNNRLIVFFATNPAVNPNLSPEVWVLTNANGLGGTPVWTKLLPNGGPPFTNAGVSVVYDAATNRLIVYGGCYANCSPSLSNVFVLTNANGLGGTPVWSQSIVQNPQDRVDPSAVYDAVNNRMIAFGGHHAFFGTDKNDTRILSNANGTVSPSAWSTLSTMGNLPSIRNSHTAIFDQVNNRMVIFGGSNYIRTCCPYDEREYNDIWALTNANGLSGTPNWMQLTPMGNLPPPRGYHSAVYDPVNNRMLVFGGQFFTNATQTTTLLGDLWQLSNANGIGGTPTWTQLSPAGTAPSPRYLHTAAFDPTNQRMIVFGGSDQLGFSNNRVWVLTNLSACTPSLTDTGMSIPVGSSPSRAVITPNGAEVYVSNNTSNTVSVISTATNTVTHTLPVGSVPDALAVAPDGSKVYVGQHGGNVSVINTATKAVSSINTLGGPVRDLAITPDGSKIYLAMEFSGLKRIDTSTNTVSAVSGFVCPEGVAVTPDGQFLYVNYQCGGPGGSGGHDAVGRFNAATGAFLGSTTGLPNVGNRISVSPDGAQVWENGGDACFSPGYNHVGCPFVPAGVLNVIATSTNTLQQSIGFAGFAPGQVSFFPDSSRAVTGSGSSLLVFDTATFTVVQTLPIAASGSLAFAANGKVYAPVPGENKIAVLSLSCSSSNRPPVADAGADQTIECAGALTPATLDGTASSDPDGDALTYEWSEGSTLLGMGATLSTNLGLGSHTITLTVTDPGGDSSTDTVVVNVVDTTPPTITCPANIVVYLPPNATSMIVNYPAPTANDNCSTPTITTNIPSGASFPIGATTVTATAEDAAHNSASCSFTVTVRYSFIGFFQPVDNLPVINVSRAGSAIPVKFSLSGYKGLQIFAAGHPASGPIPCSSSDPASIIEETVTAGDSSLSYDPGSDRYHYVWKTTRAWAGTCRRLVVRFNDGSEYYAKFQFN